MSAVILRFHRAAEGTVAGLLVDAVDEASGRRLATYPPRLMHAWLRRNGYAWQHGSNGRWPKIAAARQT